MTWLREGASYRESRRVLRGQAPDPVARYFWKFKGYCFQEPL